MALALYGAHRAKRGAIKLPIGGMLMRKFLGSVAISAALIDSAFAADLSRPSSLPGAPADLWTGIYIGGNAGYGWSNVNFTTTDQFGQGNGSQSMSGFIGGGQIGAGKTFGSLYLGLETDFQGSSLSASNGVITSNVDEFGTARARIGYVYSPQWLLYATGGAAFGHATATNTAPGINFAFPSAWGVGWTAGAGFDWMFASNWSAGVEYLHADFGGPSANLNALGSTLGIASDVSANVVRAKINLHF
jgi:outer membrane immunogenic protein